MERPVRVYVRKYGPARCMSGVLFVSLGRDSPDIQEPVKQEETKKYERMTQYRHTPSRMPVEDRWITMSNKYYNRRGIRT